MKLYSILIAAALLSGTLGCAKTNRMLGDANSLMGNAFAAVGFQPENSAIDKAEGEDHRAQELNNKLKPATERLIQVDSQRGQPNKTPINTRQIARHLAEQPQKPYLTTKQIASRTRQNKTENAGLQHPDTFRQRQVDNAVKQTVQANFVESDSAKTQDQLKLIGISVEPVHSRSAEVTRIPYGDFTEPAEIQTEIPDSSISEEPPSPVEPPIAEPQTNDGPSAVLSISG